MISRRRLITSLGFGAGAFLLTQVTEDNNQQRVAAQLPASTSATSNTLPPRGDVRLVVMSDLNSQYGSVTYDREVHQAIALIQQWQPDLVICGGDMVAGQSTKLSTPQIEAMWQAFDRTVTQPLKAAQVPFGFTLGNHDGSGYQSAPGNYVFARDRNLAKDYWQRQRLHCGLAFVDDRHFPFYYSFQQQDIFYLVWDATTAQISPTQLRWVEQSLAQAQDAALRIVIGHLPLYGVAVGRNKPGEVLNQAEQLRSLLSRYRVHTYISGHHHAYYPGRKENLDLLHAGALGGGPRALVGSTLAPFKSLTVVDVKIQAKQTRYTTLNLSTGQWVNDQILPSQITGVNGTIYRQIQPTF